MDESNLGEGTFKAQKGLIRVTAEAKSSEIESITIAGDFFMYPEDRLWELEERLKGTRTGKQDITDRIKEFYGNEDILSPGVTPEDFAEAIVRALGTSE